jgi:acetylornithine deacetylase/succinyl-diaminopimelate desuccinylase-like protein
MCRPGRAGWAGGCRGRVILLAAVAMWAVAGQAFAEPAAPEQPSPAVDSSRMASSRIPADHLQQYSDLALAWMQEYLRIDTTNPPGHEMRAVAFYKKILDQEGIENRVFEYTPGRGDLWARLTHTTADAKRPIVLLNHMDVVTSDAAHWKIPPFSGEIKDGWVWGRGAQDMKDEGLAQLVVMVMLKREKVELDRDVIFLAVADEEADGTGTDWFIAHQRDLLGKEERTCWKAAR